AAAAAAGLAAARALYPQRPRGLLAAWMLLAFAPPLLLYAGQFWVEVPAALLLALVLRALARLDPARGGVTPTRGALLALALPLIALPLLKLRFLALALPLGALAALRLRGAGRRRRELLGLAAVTLVALGLWNFWRYGNPLRMYGGGDLAIFEVPLADQLRGDFGLFFDLAFGLFALAPVWLLLLPALLLAIRASLATAARVGGDARGLAGMGGGGTDPDRRAGGFAPLPELAALLPYLLLIGMRREWYGGWSPPFRYGVALLPALALLLPPLFARKRPHPGLNFLCATLTALSGAIALVYLVHPAWAYSLANGSSRLLDELAGDFAVDLVRLLPSMVRLRPASWLVPGIVTLLVLGLAKLGEVPALDGAGAPGRAGRVRRQRRAMGATRFVWPLAALALLMVWSGLVTVAARLPTTRIEFEDAWVRHRGGALYPERWTVDRTRFSGGWAMRSDAEVAARPVAGGTTCRLSIRLLSAAGVEAPLNLEVRAGGRLIASLSVPSAPVGDGPGNRGSAGGSAGASAGAELSWVTLEVPPFALGAGETLSFRAAGPPLEGSRSFLVLDRAEVAWL
ncbi:MAG: hypothetical protein ABIV06_05445, partial [Thermoanaerobaculia bacterium]